MVLVPIKTDQKPNDKAVQKQTVFGVEAIKTDQKLSVLSVEAIKTCQKQSVFAVEAIKTYQKPSVFDMDPIKSVQKPCVFAMGPIKSAQKPSVFAMDPIKSVEKPSVFPDSQEFQMGLQRTERNLQGSVFGFWILGFWGFGILGFWDFRILDSKRFQESPKHLGSSRSLRESPGAVRDLWVYCRSSQESPGVLSLQNPTGASWSIWATPGASKGPPG